jgi:hypothetical protein
MSVAITLAAAIVTIAIVAVIVATAIVMRIVTVVRATGLAIITIDTAIINDDWAG